MSLNVLGTNDTKSYISANVNTITAKEDLRVRPTALHEGSLSFQQYTPTVLTTDNPAQLNFDRSTFLYKTVETGTELQMNIFYSIDITMINTGGSLRAFTFSLPDGYSTASISNFVGNGYMVCEFPSLLSGFRLHTLSEITKPQDDQIRLVFSNPNSNGYTGGDQYKIRGEVTIRIF